MKKNLYILSIALMLSFSMFCFLYLNSQEPVAHQSENKQLVSSEVNPSEEDEIYFPDLAVVEKLSVFISKMWKIF
jgi:hypothetical protein